MTAAISMMTIAGALTLSAQTPNPQTTPQTARPAAQQPQTDQPRGAEARSNAGDRILTVTGCLQAEKDVPGRRQSATERAGMGEDFILTNVKMSQSSTASGIGLGSMYQLKGGAVKESELKNHLGHQIEVTGSIEAHSDMRGGTAGRSSSTPAGATTAEGNSNLPNFEASSVKMISATCPAQ